MLSRSKSRRMQIMQQITFRQLSKQKTKSSLQKRKVIQNSLNDFRKTMSNLNYNNQTSNIVNPFTNSASDFHLRLNQTGSILNDNNDINIRNTKQQYDQAMKIPSFRNLKFQPIKSKSISNLHEESNFLKQESNLHKDQQADQDQHQNHHHEHHQIQAQVQRLPTFNNQNLPNQILQPLSQQKNQGNTSRKIENISKTIQNESSNSALFFTSQFQQYLNQKDNNFELKRQSEGDIKQYEERGRERENGQTEKIYKLQQSHFNNIPLLTDRKTPIKDLQSSRQNYQNKNDIKSVHKEDKIYENQHQQENDLQPVLNQLNNQIYQQNYEKTLQKNKSGHMSIASLAISNSDNNSSILKYSMAQSNFKEFKDVKDVIRNKLTNELVLDADHFIQKEKQQNEEDNSLYLVLKIQQLAERLLDREHKKFNKQIQQFLKVYKLQIKCQQRFKRDFFNAFIINQEINFEQHKNEIKSDKFIQQNEFNITANIFNYLKQQFYLQPLHNQNKATQFLRNKEKSMNQKIFRFLKINWYDKKVIKQVQLYYLSKLFSHLKRVTTQERMLKRNKYLNQYCFWLKKRMFRKLVQGVEKFQDQKRMNDNARWHYLINLKRKVFSGWKDRVNANEKYISLAMTMKNTFKQTKDQKWIQIKTVNFEQIK